MSGHHSRVSREKIPHRDWQSMSDSSYLPSFASSRLTGIADLVPRLNRAAVRAAVHNEVRSGGPSLRKLDPSQADSGDHFDLIIDAIDHLRSPVPCHVYSGDYEDLHNAMFAAFVALYGMQLVPAEFSNRSTSIVIESWEASDDELRLFYGGLLAKMGIFVTFAKNDDWIVPLAYTKPVEDIKGRAVYFPTDEFAMLRQLPIMLSHADLSRQGCEFLGARALKEKLLERFDDMLRRGYYSFMNLQGDDLEPIYHEVVIPNMVNAALEENAIVSHLADEATKEKARTATALNLHPTNPLMNVNHPDVIAFENFEHCLLDIADEGTSFGDHFTVDTGETFPLYGDTLLWFAVGTIRTMWSAFPVRLPLYLMPVSKVSDGFEFYEGDAILNPLIEHVFAHKPVLRLLLPSVVAKEDIFDTLSQSTLDPEDISTEAFLLAADVGRAMVASGKKLPNQLRRMKMEEIDPNSTCSPVDLAVNNVPFIMEIDDAHKRLYFVADMALQLVNRCGHVAVLTPTDEITDEYADLVPVDCLNLDLDINAQLAKKIGENALYRAEIEYSQNEEMYDGLFEALYRGEDISREHRKNLFHMVVQSGGFHPVDIFRNFEPEIRDRFPAVVSSASTFHLLTQQAPAAIVIADAQFIDPALLHGNLFKTRVVYSVDPQENYATADWRYHTGVDLQLNSRTDMDRIKRIYA